MKQDVFLPIRTNFHFGFDKKAFRRQYWQKRTTFATPNQFPLNEISSILLRVRRRQCRTPMSRSVRTKSKEALELAGKTNGWIQRLWQRGCIRGVKMSGRKREEKRGDWREREEKRREGGGEKEKRRAKRRDKERRIRCVAFCPIIFLDKHHS